jgi:apolipoprotein N-acyltransferase
MKATPCRAASTGLAADLGAALGGGLWLAICLPVLWPGLSSEELFQGGPSEPLAFLGLVPLLVRLEAASARRAFWLGYLAGLAFFGAALFWLTEVMTTFGRLPMLAAVPILLLLLAFLALFWAAPLGLALRLERLLGWRRVWTLPLLWVAFELLRNHVLTGFPWANLGYTQVRGLWLAQLAALGGVYLVAWVVVLGNTCLTVAWGWLRRRTRPARLELAWVLVWLLVLGLAGLWAGARLAGPAAPEDARRVRAAVVQGNLDERARLRGAAAQRWVLETLWEVSRSAIQEQGARLVIWPEGTLPEALWGEAPELHPQAGRPPPLPAEWVLGALTRQVVDGETRQWNSAWLFDGRLQAVARYDKVHLVPFGEYVPLASILPWRWFVPEGVSFFTPGEQVRPLEARAGRLGVLICYEAIFPELTRALVKEGAELLVNITNDAWFGRTSAPWQHLAMSRMRAIEADRFMLRAANTGVSAIIDPRGRVLAELPLGLALSPREQVRLVELEPPGVLVAEVALLAGRTPYAWLGDVPAWGCLGFALLAWLWSVWRARLRAS